MMAVNDEASPHGPQATRPQSPILLPIAVLRCVNLNSSHIARAAAYFSLPSLSYSASLCDVCRRFFYLAFSSSSSLSPRLSTSTAPKANSERIAGHAAQIIRRGGNFTTPVFLDRGFYVRVRVLLDTLVCRRQALTPLISPLSSHAHAHRARLPRRHAAASPRHPQLRKQASSVLVRACRLTPRVPRQRREQRVVSHASLHPPPLLVSSCSCQQ